MDATDYIKKISDGERRFFESPIEFEVRDGNADKDVIVGYAAVFNKDSEDFGGWVERIAPGFFDDVMQDDAVALFNHDINQVLGRNGVNVTLTQDNFGLKYRIKVPKTTLASDVRQLVEDKIISKSSFAFSTKEHKWENSPGPGLPAVRTLVKAKRLWDVSPVTFPAYPDTTVGTRSFKAEQETENDKAGLALWEMERRLKINKIKLK